MTSPTRFGRVAKGRMGPTRETVTRYLPENYHVFREDESYFYIEGLDYAGWTLDGYVIPRLGSGMYNCKETNEEGELLA